MVVTWWIVAFLCSGSKKGKGDHVQATGIVYILRVLEVDVISLLQDQTVGLEADIQNAFLLSWLDGCI